MANFDLLPDDDDVHAAAALGSILKHSDFEGINYYAVAGSYGTQEGYTFINTTVPDFFNVLFGSENVNWTNADEDWDGSVDRASDKVINILNAGGKVFVQEAGQSDFTYDVMQTAINSGVSLAIIEDNVTVVQHSNWNQNNTSSSKLDWLQDNVNYIKIADGNTSDNGTPNYKTTDTEWMELAIATSNPNSDAQIFWGMANDICDAWTVYNNPAIRVGGVDYSDIVESWYILDLDTKADDVESFWNNYVINEPIDTENVVVTGVSLNLSELTFSELEETKNLLASIEPANASNEIVSWISSDDEIATVNANGEVMAIGNGVATITVTTLEGGFTASSVITVNTDEDKNNVNIALGGVATQSSIAYDGEPSLAIDGNTNGSFGGGSVTHTNSENNPWWQVALSEESILEEIVISNRTDKCCMERLSDFTVSVLDKEGNITFSETFEEYPDPSLIVNVNGALGNIVRIELTGVAVLSLAEVEVYSSEEETLTVSQPTNEGTLVYITKRNATGYAIDGGIGAVNGQSVTLSAVNTSDEGQLWVEVDRENGYYSYEKYGTNYSLDGNDDGANNQVVYLKETNDTDQNQQWEKEDQGDGSYKLIKRNATGYTINGGSGAVEGKEITLWNSNVNNQNLQWYITPVEQEAEAVEIRIIETVRIEAEDYDAMSGIQTEASTESGDNVGWINDGDWLRFDDVNLSGLSNMDARIACNFAGGTIEVRIGSTSGTLIGSIDISNTGGNQDWITESTSLSNASGTNDVYLVFTGVSGYLFNVNWVEFNSNSTSSKDIIASVVDGNVTLYPNPVVSTTTIQGAANSTITIYNMNGSTVFTKVIANEIETIDLSNLSVGVYYARIEGVIATTIVKELKN